MNGWTDDREAAEKLMEIALLEKELRKHGNSGLVEWTVPVK